MKKLGFLIVVLLVSVTSTYAQFTFTGIDCPGADATGVIGINNHGDMVGHYRLPGGVLHAMMIKRGKCIPLAPTTILGASPSHAFKINDRGDIAGWFVDDSGAGHGFLLSSGALTILDFPGASDTVAWGINNSGTVVGWWDIVNADGNIITHGYIWNHGDFEGVDVPGAAYTAVQAINDFGDLVGEWGQDPTGNTGSGFFWPKGQGPFISFDGPFPGTVETQGNGVNDVGAIVAFSLDAGGVVHSFLRVGLPAVVGIDYPGAVSTSVWGINSRFQIVGIWRDGSGASHGFRAQPGE